MFEEFKDSSFKFYIKWLDITDNLELKVLIMVSCLSKFRYRYTDSLSSICNWLGVSGNPYTNNNLKQAFNNLEDKGYIKYTHTNKQHTIQLCVNEDDDIFYFRYCWLEELRKFNKNENNQRINKKISADWARIVRVFIYITMYMNDNFVYSQGWIAADLDISRGSITDVLTAITGSRLDGITFDKRKVKRFSEKLNKLVNRGTRFEIGFNFTDM